MHAKVRKLDEADQYQDAVGLSVGTNDLAVPPDLQKRKLGGTSQELHAVDRLDRALQTDITRAQVRLLGAADDARIGYGALELAIPVLAIIAGLLVLLGLERRIAEYR